MIEQELKEALKACFIKPPAGFAARSEGQLARLIENGSPRSIRKGPILAALTALLALSLATGLAITNVWGVKDFLFGLWRGEEIDLPVHAVRQEIDCKTAYMRIDSALYDGRSLIFDWMIENKSEIPMYCSVRRFTANGERLATDGTDDFDNCWIRQGEDHWQDGELILLPEALTRAETLAICMEVTLYYPERPVYWSSEDDPALAARMAAAGNYVIPAEGFGYAMYDEEERTWGFGMGAPAEDMGGFTTQELRFAFSVSMQPEENHALAAKPSYAKAGFTASYPVAEVTPLGLYLRLRYAPEDALAKEAGEWMLTDGAGTPVYDRLDDKVNCWFTGYSQKEDGCLYRYWDFQWYGLTEADLPDVISLTWLPENGDPVLFPVRVR